LVSVNSDGYGKFACYGSGDFSSLPPLRIMDECVLENQAVLGRSGACFYASEKRFFCAEDLHGAGRTLGKIL